MVHATRIVFFVTRVILLVLSNTHKNIFPQKYFLINFLITNTVAATQLRELRREVRMSAEEARRRGEEYAMKTMGRTMKAIEMTDEDAAEYGQLFASVEGEVR